MLPTLCGPRIYRFCLVYLKLFGLFFFFFSLIFFPSVVCWWFFNYTSLSLIYVRAILASGPLLTTQKIQGLQAALKGNAPNFCTLKGKSDVLGSCFLSKR